MSTKKHKSSWVKKTITKAEKDKLLQIFDILSRDNQSREFLQPVDYISLGIPDYPKIITKPMDLGTVKKNLLENKYNSIFELKGDVCLIWANCRNYNVHGSDICKMSTHCEKVFNKHFDRYFQTKIDEAKYSHKWSQSVHKHHNEEKETNPNDIYYLDEEEEEIATIPQLGFLEKEELSKSIRTLDDKGLAILVKYLSEESPLSLEDVDSQYIQIKLDKIPNNKYQGLVQAISPYLKNL